MSANYGTAMVLGAGVLTFGNEWLQTSQLNWRVPVAALLGAGAIGVIGAFSTSAANSLGFMVLLAATATRFNGKSALDELNSALPRNKQGA